MANRGPLLRNLAVLLAALGLALLLAPRLFRQADGPASAKRTKSLFGKAKITVADLELGYDRKIAPLELWQAFKNLAETGAPPAGDYAPAHDLAWGEAKKGNLDKALSALAPSLAAKPGAVDIQNDLSCLYCLFGWMRFNEKKYADALPLFERALEIRDRNFLALQGKACLAYEDKDLSTAEDILTDILAEGGNHPEVYLLLGLVYYDLERLDEALEHLEFYLTLRPGNEEVRKLVAKLKRERKVENHFSKWDSRHFTIKYEGDTDEAAAVRVEEAAEGAYYDVGSEYDRFPARNITIILYTNEQFQDVTHVPAWAGAVFDGKIRIPARGIGDDNELRMVVHHEYTHALIYDAASEGVPTWFHEGMAQISQYKVSDDWLSELSEEYEILSKFFLDHGGPWPLSRLEGGFTGFNADQAVMAYLESYLAVKYMEREYGNQALRDVLAKLGEQKPWSTAFSASTGVSPARFESDFQAWVREQGDWDW